jgi:predicted flap endonuclease-1-like 5' DNA nuclease
MFLLTQWWIFWLLAAAIGAFIAWRFGLCNCDKSGLEAELEGVRGERDDLTVRLAAAGSGGAAVGALAANANSERRIAGLEAELAEARVKADELAGAAAKAKSSEPALDDEDAAAMKWRNRYLEARVKFLEEQSTAAPIAAGLAGAAIGAAVAAPKAVKAKAAPKVEAKPEPVSNENFTPSTLANLSGEELEAATLAAVANAKAPPRSRKRSNPDDLLLIDGVGPKNNAWLNEQGIYYFHQIATMNIEQVAWLAENLPTFGSRVYRENWVAQCTNLARGNPARG